MEKLTNGHISSDHYGPVGDAARQIASYCDGNARVHVYTAAFDALQSLAAENARLKALVHQLGENTATAAREYAEGMDAMRGERDKLAGLVQGWHYLAVGPDEMGDYYTHKQLVKASEPYASHALRNLTKQGDE